MSVLPIDLQVLFSKSTEHSENIARHSNAAQMGQMTNFEKVRKESVEINEKIKETDEYAEDFTKIQPDGEGYKEQAESHSQKREKEEKPHEYKPALKEEGKGTIIDVVE
ncbi:MAG: hypothetical protein N2258_01350 [Brevinematales bacterium]|nr:hypothetical protein [Brevinematales bacterium]